jgi:arylsulfatase B
MTRVDSRPYFISLSYNAPHTIPGGYERPPNNLHGYDLISAGPVDDQVHFDAVVQAMDTELGRVLARVDYSTTTVILVGDNGTAARVRRPPYGPRGCKSSIYQCGVAVPFVIAGKGVAGTVPRVDRRLTQDVDLFPTILQLAGINPATVVPAGRKIDGKSLVGYMTTTTGNNGRVYSYNETFTTTWNNKAVRSMRGGRYKLVTRGANQELYNLVSDPHETTNLIGAPLSNEAAEARTRLLAEMNALLATR